MWRSVRAGGALFAAVLALISGGRAADAASEVSVGGFVDQGMDAAHRDLVDSDGGATSGGQALQFDVVSGPESALTAFTPRVGGLALGLGHHGDHVGPQAGAGEQLRIGLDDLANIAGFDVGLAARATMPQTTPSQTSASSGLAVGGELAVSSLRFDATYGEDAARLGFEAGRRVTAGVAYGLGPVDTRLSYSLIEQDQAAEHSSLLTIGSKLTLRPGFVVQGDVAYADDERGDANTAGRVSLRLNF